MTKILELGKVSNIKRGKSITKKSIFPGNVPVIAGGREPAYFHSEANRDGPIITVSGSGAYAGFVNFYNQPIFVSDSFTIKSLNENEVLTKFLFFSLKAKQNLIYSLQSGAGQPHVYPKDLITFTIPDYCIQEQQKIVSTLEEIDDLRQKQRKAIELTRQMIPSLFYEMFGDIESNEKGFDRIKAKEVTTINPKNQVSLEDSDEITFVQMSAINAENASIRTPEIKLMAETRRKGFSYFKEGDVLFAKITPCMQNKKSAIAKHLINGIGYGSTEFHVLRPTACILGEYLLQILRSPKFIEIAKNHFTGTAGQQRVPKDFIANFTISLPPIELQKRFAIKAQECLSLLEHQEQALQKLDALFESTLNRFFST